MFPYLLRFNFNKTHENYSSVENPVGSWNPCVEGKEGRDCCHVWCDSTYTKLSNDQTMGKLIDGSHAYPPTTPTWGQELFVHLPTRR